MHSFTRFTLLSLTAASVLGHPQSLLPSFCPSGRRVSSLQCCKWFDVLADIQTNLFQNECGFEAHEALRITFHDAIGFSHSAGPAGGGGADGSLIMNSDVELTYDVNQPLDFIVDSERSFAIKHQVSFGDFIQFAGAVGLSNCPGAPRLQFLAGRPNTTSGPAPDNSVPEPFWSTDEILNRMNDAGFTAEELVHLLASHSVAQAAIGDEGFNLDTTPGTFDTQFYLETLLKGTDSPGNGTQGKDALSPFPDEIRLVSDYVIPRDSRTACEWQSMLTDQKTMQTKFQQAMAKLAIVGQNPSLLTDCSEVIPMAQPLTNVGSGTAKLPPGKTVNDVERICPSPLPPLQSESS